MESLPHKRLIMSMISTRASGRGKGPVRVGRLVLGLSQNELIWESGRQLEV
jgi:hypothetical protein